MWVAEFPVLDLELVAGVRGKLFGVGFAGFVSVGRGISGVGWED
jgi:hypothetical protein